MTIHESKSSVKRFRKPSGYPTSEEPPGIRYYITIIHMHGARYRKIINADDKQALTLLIKMNNDHRVFTDAFGSNAALARHLKISHGI